jgi:Mechanosensitive ion channel, beta-domain
MPPAAVDIVPADPTDGGVSDAADAAPELDATLDAELDADEPETVEAAVEAAVPPPAASSASVAPPPIASASPPPPTAVEPKPQDTSAPLWNIFPILPESDGGDDGGLAEQLLPTLGLGERGNLFGFGFLVVFSALAAFVSGRARRRLPMRGVLPRTLAFLNVGMRTLVVVFALALLANWIPASFAPVLLWVALAAAAAAGWSARDFLPDLFAGMVLIIERRLRPGTWVSGSGFVGEVQTLGPRAARLRDVEGRIVTVPNRKLLGGPVAIDTSRWPRIDVVIRVHEHVGAAAARQAIEDAALLSPWRVLRDRPEVRRDANDPRAWRVRVRLLEPRFVRAFESALVDHVEETLAVGGTERPQVELADTSQIAPST